jgi:DNA-binding HxlR family transcriptional regulator
MARHTVTEKLFDEMSAFNRRLRACFDMRSQETGLTLTRARVLFALSRRGSLNQKELAQELEIETPTLVRILDGMEKQQLIERRMGGSDRRVKEIHVTPEGERVGWSPAFRWWCGWTRRLHPVLNDRTASGDLKQKGPGSSDPGPFLSIPLKQKIRRLRPGRRHPG